jgi:DNA-binding CsgD family transcriptional regulator
VARIAWLRVDGVPSVQPWALGPEHRRHAASLSDIVDFALQPEAANGVEDADVQQMRLTAREIEVASLVAAGKSNREIANILVISERTAETHVMHIRHKLHVSSRTAIAVWAAQRGLLVHASEIAERHR